MKLCKHCEAELNDDATVCPFCKSIQTEKKVEEKVQSTSTKNEDEWIYKYADFLDSNAKVKTGKMFQNGLGVKKDLNIALDLYYKAALEGNLEGMYFYAELIRTIDKNPINISIAIDYYKIAAESGHKPSINRLRELGVSFNVNEENKAPKKEYSIKNEISIEDVIEKVTPYCAEILSIALYNNDVNSQKSALLDSANIKCMGQGSGVVTHDGLLITNAHVILYPNEQKKSLDICDVILANFDKYEKVSLVPVLVDAKADVAICLVMLEFDRGYIGNAPKLVENLSIKKGQSVFTIGNGLGEGLGVTKGIISKELIKGNTRDIIRTDLLINHGNSGGGLFTLSGNVIGMMTFVPKKSPKSDENDIAYGISYAVASTTIAKKINEVKEKLK